MHVCETPGARRRVARAITRSAGDKRDVWGNDAQGEPNRDSRRRTGRTSIVRRDSLHTERQHANPTSWRPFQPPANCSPGQHAYGETQAYAYLSRHAHPREPFSQLLARISCTSSSATMTYINMPIPCRGRCSPDEHAHEELRETNIHSTCTYLTSCPLPQTPLPAPRPHPRPRLHVRRRGVPLDTSHQRHPPRLPLYHRFPPPRHARGARAPAISARDRGAASLCRPQTRTDPAQSGSSCTMGEEVGEAVE